MVCDRNMVISFRSLRSLSLGIELGSLLTAVEIQWLLGHILLGGWWSTWWGQELKGHCGWAQVSLIWTPEQVGVLLTFTMERSVPGMTRDVCLLVPNWNRFWCCLLIVKIFFLFLQVYLPHRPFVPVIPNTVKTSIKTDRREKAHFIVRQSHISFWLIFPFPTFTPGQLLKAVT